MSAYLIPHPIFLRYSVQFYNIFHNSGEIIYVGSHSVLTLGLLICSQCLCRSAFPGHWYEQSHMTRHSHLTVRVLYQVCLFPACPQLSIMKTLQAPEYEYIYMKKNMCCIAIFSPLLGDSLKALKVNIPHKTSEQQKLDLIVS